MAIKTKERRAVAAGDYLLLESEVRIEKHDTALRVAPSSVGRYVRQAWDPAYAVVLLGNWHMRVPWSSLSFLRPSDGPLPFPWVDNVIQKSLNWGETNR